MELKPYQDRALDALRVFLDAARVKPHAAAFADAIKIGEPGAYAVGGYRAVEGLPGVPYACIRLPTGGGKTLLAAHAIKVAADSYMERARVPVIWLVPSSTIQTQTLDALKQPRHPYRRALDDAFGGAVTVFDVSERRMIRPKDFAEKTVVIVGTHQAFNRRSRESLKVYQDDENLEDHFAGVTPDGGLALNEDGPRAGKVALSFANVLHRQRPLMILDEAHNFMTGLAGEVKARLNPSAIVEFTATPEQGTSNVIAAATAMELKTADMIKMPIHLSQHLSWEQAVTHAVGNRAWLAEIAARDGGGIRPIALYQARPAIEGADAKVEDVKRYLIESERIPDEAIAVATGSQRDLEGVDLFDPACKIEHVITVQALKEGWDCSFAYVFCSLASIRAPGAVEQLLGRVLRLPFATRRPSEELNRAYAHVSEANFAAAAEGLKDRLTDMGFDERTAREAILPPPEELPLGAGGLFDPSRPVVLNATERPNLTDWPVEMQRAVRIAATDDGGVRIEVSADAPDEVKREVARRVEAASPGAGEAVERHIARREELASPASRGVPFALPRLHLTVQGELELAEPETFVDLAGWSLLAGPVTLPGFSLTETPQGIEFDIEGDRIVSTDLDAAPELALDLSAAWDEGELARFLDRQTRQLHTGQDAYLEYCRRVVRHLIADRGMTLAALVRGKYALRRALISRVAALRKEAAQRGFQLFLDGLAAPALPREAGAMFTFDPNAYDARNRYMGGHRFRKHYHFAIGDLKASGDEFECAREIDRMPDVKHWIRNVDRTRNCYWIPTSVGRFHPDFVAELNDGRILIVEYKGRMDEEARIDAEAGRAVEAASGGKVLFLMAVARDAEQRDVAAQLAAKVSATGG